jgi:hypothetical protein
MNYIKQILRLYENTKERAFSSWEISLFKSLNRNKEKLGTKKDYQSFISRYLEASGMDPREALYYYYVYSSNYRPDGQYDEIKKGEQKIPAFDNKAKRTSNIKMGEFAQNKIPFKGNNVESQRNGKEQGNFYR